MNGLQGIVMVLKWRLEVLNAYGWIVFSYGLTIVLNVFLSIWVHGYGGGIW